MNSVPVPCVRPSTVSKVSGSDGFKPCHVECEGMRDSSKCARLLAELKSFSVDVAAVQETHYICTADC